MNITIIEVGLANEAIRADFDDYPSMFAQLVSGADAGLSFSTISPIKGEDLPDPADLDAILITGSANGVYDTVPWMAPLMDFIRQTANAHTPMVGICFGHQAIAEAMGGHAAKSDKGWALGRHAYELAAHPDWMADKARRKFSLFASHQDQVLKQPPDTCVIARSDFTPYAGLEYTAAPIISFQGHPEIEDDLAIAMIGVREGLTHSQAEADTSRASLQAPHDSPLVGEWLARFYRQAK
jgi:GMP synthase-like glutamine amidotransferase